MDADFPPQKISLSGHPIPQDYDSNWDQISWKACNEIYPNAVLYNDINPDDINQGYLGDCYLLSIISALTEQPFLIERLFEIK